MTLAGEVDKIKKYVMYKYLVTGLVIICCCSLSYGTTLETDSAPAVKMSNRDYGVESDTLFFVSFDNGLDADYTRDGVLTAITGGNVKLLDNGKFGKAVTGFTVSGDKLRFSGIGSDMLTGDNSTFTSSLGSWVAEAGTVTNPSSSMSVGTSSTQA